MLGLSLGPLWSLSLERLMGSSLGLLLGPSLGLLLDSSLGTFLGPWMVPGEALKGLGGVLVVSFGIPGGAWVALVEPLGGL